MLTLKAGEKLITTERPAFVMGIVNVTPDSFYENSRGGIERALQLIEEGADILDIGGESTRPGFETVDTDEEITRLLPVLKEIRKHSDIPVSIDTRKSEVMKICAENGADILNDVTALEYDCQNLNLVKDKNLSVILMHNGEGNGEQVRSYLLKRAEICKSYGIPHDKIILDPGIGFGKTNEQNIELISLGNKITDSKYPLLMALSRKRVIGYMTGREVQDRLSGTLAADILSVIKGASLVRVHDVAQTIDTLNVMMYINK